MHRLVARLEEAEGCDVYEGFCPFGHLAEYCDERAEGSALHEWASLSPVPKVTKGQCVDHFRRCAPKLIADARHEHAAFLAAEKARRLTTVTMGFPR